MKLESLHKNPIGSFYRKNQDLQHWLYITVFVGVCITAVPSLGQRVWVLLLPDQPWLGSLLSPAQDLCQQEFGDPYRGAESILFSFLSGVLIVNESISENERDDHNFS